MNTALKKITAEAKRIRKRHPGKKWITAVKEAGAKFRQGKIRVGKIGKGVGSIHRKRKKVGSTKSGQRKNIVRILKDTHHSEGTLINKLESLGAIKARGRKVVKEKLKNALVNREMSKTKTAKRKAAKKVVALKRQLNQFC